MDLVDPLDLVDRRYLVDQLDQFYLVGHLDLLVRPNLVDLEDLEHLAYLGHRFDPFDQCFRLNLVHRHLLSNLGYRRHLENLVDLVDRLDRLDQLDLVDLVHQLDLVYRFLLAYLLGLGDLEYLVHLLDLGHL